MDTTTAKGRGAEIELSRSQQALGRRAAESKATIPHFALEAEIDMRACIALRDGFAQPRPSFTDLVLRAAAIALREHPRVNSSYRDGRLQLHERVNVGFAVAISPGDPAGAEDPAGPNDPAGAEDPAGVKDPAGESVLIPTVFDADSKPLQELAGETRELAARARSGSIEPPELGGATFTVANLGMLGVRALTPIVQPPQAAILAVGAIEPRALAEDGLLVAAEQMSATLACDQRILQGADAARFLARVKALLQAPAALVG